MKNLDFITEKEKILDQIVGGRCYYPDVRIWMHPFVVYLVYYSRKLKISPNALSITNLFVSIICLFCFYSNFFIAAFFLFWLRGILDCSDGALARYSNQTSKFGKILDSAIDWPFYISLWILVALKISNIYIAFYFLLSSILYVILVEYLIEPRLKNLVKRAPIKQYFLDRGFIIGFGVFTVLEFWTLALFALNNSFAREYIYVLVILVNLDLLYRIYETLRYKKK